MNARKDILGLAIRVAVFVVLFYGMGFVLDPLLRWTFQDLAGPTFAVFFSSLFATWLALRIYEAIPVIDIGLWWNRCSGDNLMLGVAGGVGAACLSLGLPLLTGAATIVWKQPPELGGLAFALVCVAAGSTGEEIFFRGYALQLMVRRIGPWAAVLPVGVVFGLMHSANPYASPLGLVNTAGFGILFGYAYLRSRDLWLPIGLHFGWNVTLPLFGANLSGITIFKEIVGYEMTWRAGTLWSGGSYGPEASIITSAALIPLALFLRMAPVRRQASPLIDPPAEGAICESSPSSPS